jgi:hypothetical protein
VTLIDPTHANPLTEFQALGSPAYATPAQVLALDLASKLAPVLVPTACSRTSDATYTCTVTVWLQPLATATVTLTV